ncbi:MAG: FeoB-associated Cys-rich membrane protein [Clostridiales bacterium]|nr:FeoB-associated Cys-rich membrane protein [Clostridiales bacterium]
MINYVIGALAIIIVASVIINSFRQNKKGKSSCGCGCSSCASKNRCHSK